MYSEIHLICRNERCDHSEPDIWMRSAASVITKNKDGGGDEVPVELFQSWRWCCTHSQQLGKVFIPTATMPKNRWHTNCNCSHASNAQNSAQALHMRIMNCQIARCVLSAGCQHPLDRKSKRVPNHSALSELPKPWSKIIAVENWKSENCDYLICLWRNSICRSEAKES